MKLLKYLLGGLAVTAAVGTGVVVYKWWKGRKKNDIDDYDEENNHPELRYGVYKNPIDGPSWRLEPGEYYNPALKNESDCDCAQHQFGRTKVVSNQAKEFKAPILGDQNTPTDPPWMSRPDLLEGDIMLESIASSRVSVNKQIHLWPGGIVPYVFDSGLTMLARTVITKAMQALKTLSCVRFIPRASGKYFVRFIRGQGCYSSVGRTLDPNGQVVSIGYGCEHEAIILHELMHTLGFFHTSSRPDRDAYVIIYSKNIRPGFEGNFRKYSHGQVDRLGAPYDYTSLMHLPRNSWSIKGKNTIESRAGPHVVLGQRKGLSVVDRQQLNQLYKCSNNRGCYFAVGLEKGKISDSQLRASSSQLYYEPHQARLHLNAGPKGNGAWCTARNAIGQYLQIDLGSRHKITAIATQGGPRGLFLPAAWVTGYKVQSNNNGNIYSWVTNVQFLSGNWDANSVQYHSLKVPFWARYVRIVPTHWYNHICLRVELYGCK